MLYITLIIISIQNDYIQHLIAVLYNKERRMIMTGVLPCHRYCHDIIVKGKRLVTN